jgi:hypothetical protein
VTVAVLGRTSWSQLHGATSEAAMATEPDHCVCPCFIAGHRADKTCRVRIVPGDRYRLVMLRTAARPRPVAVCTPCWTAIDRDATAREGSR